MKGITGFVTVVALGFTLATAHAKDTTPSATIKLSGGSVAAGVGVDWGRGTLTYRGKQYPISVKGVSVGDVGVTTVEASGKVFGLKSLGEFDGNYTTVGAGATAAGGGGVAMMRNQNGVRVELVSTTQGVDIDLGAAGVDMNIKK